MGWRDDVVRGRSRFRAKPGWRVDGGRGTNKGGIQPLAWRVTLLPVWTMHREHRGQVVRGAWDSWDQRRR